MFAGSVNALVRSETHARFVCKTHSLSHSHEDFADYYCHVPRPRCRVALVGPLADRPPCRFVACSWAWALCLGETAPHGHDLYSRKTQVVVGAGCTDGHVIHRLYDRPQSYPSLPSDRHVRFGMDPDRALRSVPIRRTNHFIGVGCIAQASSHR